jgi:glycosyltransferase involved in cell wall biosynthesis
MYLSIITPMHNEENTIGVLLEQLVTLSLPGYVKNFEIVVVDDCSTDRSAAIVEEFVKSYDRIKLVGHDINQGKGAAVHTGIGLASGDTILVRDADLELSVKDIPFMLNAMVELDVEFVNGSRYMAGVNRPLASYKRFMANRLFTTLTSILIDVKLTDMACGYKLFKKSLYDKIEFKEKRFGFEAEILIKALKFKPNNIAEVPVHYFPRDVAGGKKLRHLDGLKILWAILKYGLFQ